jgi:hypothetical protein
MPSNYYIVTTMHLCKYGLPQAGKANVTISQPPGLHHNLFKHQSNCHCGQAEEGNVTIRRPPGVHHNHMGLNGGPSSSHNMMSENHIYSPGLL